MDEDSLGPIDNIRAVNDPFANGPLTFRPRAEARTGHVFGILFFVAMAAFCWAPYFMSNKGHAFFAGFGALTSAFFLAFMAMMISAYRHALGPIEIDRQGVTARGRRVLWTEVVGVAEERLPEKMVVLRTAAGKPFGLSIASYQDGPEMGRVVQSLVPTAPVGQEETTTYVLTDRKTGVFGFGAMLALSLFLVYFSFQVPAPPRALIHPGVLQLVILVPGLLWLIVRSATSYARITPSELTVGSAFGKKTINLALVDSISRTEKGVEVRAGSQTITIGKIYVGYAELQQRLLQLAPKGAEANGEPISLGAEEVFGARRGAWTGPAFAGAFCGGLGVAGIVAGTQSIMAGNLNGGIFLMLMCAIPGCLGLGGIYAAVMSRTSYAVDADGIEERSPIRTIRIHWRDVESAWRTGNLLKSYRLKTPARELEVSGEFLQDAPRLMALLDARFASLEAKEAKRIEGETFGPSGNAIGTGLFIGFFGLLVTGAGGSAGQWMAVRPGEESGRTLLSLMWLAAGLGMLFLGLMVNVRKYTPTADGLVVRTLKGGRFLRWNEITRAETTRLNGKSPRTMLVLEHADGTVKIDGMMTREFARLKGIILAHVDPSVVREDLDAA